MKSPCIKVCRLIKDVCVGCNRTLEEIRLWSTLSDVERDVIMKKTNMSEGAKELQTTLPLDD